MTRVFALNSFSPSLEGLSSTKENFKQRASYTSCTLLKEICAKRLLIYCFVLWIICPALFSVNAKDLSASPFSPPSLSLFIQSRFFFAHRDKNWHSDLAYTAYSYIAKCPAQAAMRGGWVREFNIKSHSGAEISCPSSQAIIPGPN